MGTSCDRLWEIDPYRKGRLAANAAESFHRHLGVCADCRSQMQRDEELRELAGKLPDPGPTDLALRRLRARVLRDSAIGVPGRAAHGRRLGAFTILVAVSLSASLLLVFRHASRAKAVTTIAVAVAPRAPDAPLGPGSEALAGSVVSSSSDARWSQVREAGIERMYLDQGAVRVHVRPQLSGERFLVMLPDGEIKVRGTTFDVSVERGATRHIYVVEGVVDLHLRDRELRRLSAQEGYDAPALLPPAASPAPPQPLRVFAPPPHAAPSATSPTEDHAGAYAAAIELLREGRGEQSAAAFHALVLAEPGTPQAEDASFLEAVALARAGRTDAAALAAEHHLASFPDSFRRKEATILVARAAGLRGDCVKARALMAPWKHDSDPNVRSAIGSCEDRTP